jgi:hypothetical protein
LNYAQRLLPASVVPTLGPDGTGVTYFGTIWNQWNGFREQRALQDWYVNLPCRPFLEWLKLLLWRFRKAIPIGFRSFKNAIL